jgi:CheY-like chemotaxis protein
MLACHALEMSQPMPNNVILLAEDQEDDVFLVQHALLEAGLPNPLLVVHDGIQALQYLAGQGQYGDREKFPLPMLVLLDLDMPLMDGFAVLTSLRREPRFRQLPVVVLTGSSLSPDVSRAYRLGANSFLVKPAGVEQLRAALTEMVHFWSAHQPVLAQAGTVLPLPQAP